MDFQSPRRPTTVRRNPPRRAKQTPATNAPAPSTSKQSIPSVAAAAAAADGSGGIPPFPINDILNAAPPYIPIPESPIEIPPPTPKPSASPIPKSPVEFPPPTPNPSDPVAGEIPARTVNPSSDNLKVFLRIRPLEPRPRPNRSLAVAKARRKAVSPPVGKVPSSNNACLVVNDSTSVTLLAPSSAHESKRAKSEIYDGFSHVFPPDSRQKDIYDRVMDPLVMDFIGGKTALLAAMGPTGSGKTHTIFGCPREPGLVPLALQKIFSHESDNEDPDLSRSYFLSMFEIYSERGKGERILDLLSHGADLLLQQSTVKGLQENMISDVAEAESLIARGMLKRATATTNSNIQSSRSQCIINIRCALGSCNEENNVTIDSATLTIADLAGAEKEKKTGNQGARLLESNFINNTSMVFGLCLRSLLEHQKNPKKTFQKHFKNSMLTRYLKDFLEGKKRMTLILTARPGEDDYLDTSFLLRQASPYMKIKFTSQEDLPYVASQKRNMTSLIRKHHQKRRKCIDSPSLVEDGNDDKEVVVPEHHVSDEGIGSESHEESELPQSLRASSSLKEPPMVSELNVDQSAELQRMTRNDEVMCKFARALWTVLKQYKEKLQASESEVQNLKESLKEKTTQIMKLEKHLKESRSCSCCDKSLEDASIFEFNSCATGLPLASTDSNNIKHIDVLTDADLLPVDTCPSDAEAENNREILDKGDDNCILNSLVEQSTLSMEDKLRGQATEIFSENRQPQKNFEIPTGCGVSKVSSNSDTIETCSEESDYPKRFSCVDDGVTPHVPVEKVTLFVEDKQMDQSCNDFLGKDQCCEDLEEPIILGVKETPIIARLADCTCPEPSISNTQLLDSGRDAEHLSGCYRILPEEEGSHQNCELSEEPKCMQMELLNLPHLAGTQSHSVVQSSQTHGVEEDAKSILPSQIHTSGAEIIKQPKSHMSRVEDDRQSDNSQDKDIMGKENHEPNLKSLVEQKPKRRLLPASAMLLKGFSGLDMAVNNPKESKSKVSAEANGRSQGSISLVHLIRNDLNQRPT